MPPKLRGLSLAEAVLGLFLLSSGVFLIAQIVHVAFWQGAGQLRQRVALDLARDTLSEIRDWARLPDNFADWTPYRNLSRSDSSNQYQIQVQVDENRTSIYSPSQTLEEPWGLDAKRIEGGLAWVEVRVTGANPRPVVLTSYVGRPAAQPDATLVLSPLSAGPLAKDAAAQFRAQALDLQGRPINDLVFHWTVMPVSGNGSVRLGSQREHQQAELVHRSDRKFAPFHIPGTVNLRCTTLYHGQTLNATLGPIELLP